MFCVVSNIITIGADAMEASSLARAWPPHRSLPSLFYQSQCCHPFSSSIWASLRANDSSGHVTPSRCVIKATHCSTIANQPDELKPAEKLLALRQLFTRSGVMIDAYIIPSEDAHQGEFIAESYMRRAYITGFTGSAGTAVVTKDKAALWTDGRYFLQAEKQLSPDWMLMKAGSPGVLSTGDWLNEVLPHGCKIGIDPFLFSCNAAEDLKSILSKNNNKLVYPSNINLVDEIWKSGRPKLRAGPIRVHDLKYAGSDVSSKLSFLRRKLEEASSDAILISMLDEIAWLLNLRGSDIPHSPLAYAYLIVEIGCAKLFVEKAKIIMEAQDHLSQSQVELRPYDSILSEIESLAARGRKLWMDTSSVNIAIVDSYRSACKMLFGVPESQTKGIPETGIPAATSIPVHLPHGIYKASPVALAKAVKNNAEIEGMKNAHLRDAAALAEFWSYLESEVHKDVPITEVNIVEKLLEFRMKQKGFLDTSFDTISAFGANGAMIHYNPEPWCCNIVNTRELLLLDSGAQYIDGTTDVTRTVHFGEPTPWQKECFTRVLQGHIALDQAVFPENTPGFVLDILARSFLWKIGLDYRHGTGHGVGAALNVHEGPQSISFRYGNTTSLQEGMIVSNEPGYYEECSFGIRIENLLYVKEAKTSNRFGGSRYLGFEKLTFVPIQSKMIEHSFLSSSELDWLNDYHLQVWEKVSPLVDGRALQWLRNSTKPLCQT